MSLTYQRQSTAILTAPPIDRHDWIKQIQKILKYTTLPYKKRAFIYLPDNTILNTYSLFLLKPQESQLFNSILDDVMDTTTILNPTQWDTTIFFMGCIMSSLHADFMQTADHGDIPFTPQK